MKRSLPLAVLALLVCCAFTGKGAPLRNYPQKLVQPDGSVIHCFASGDEFDHWLHDRDNYTIVQHPATGYFVYALQEKGELIPSDYIVGRWDPSSVGVAKGVHRAPTVAMQRKEAFNAMVAGVHSNAPLAAFLNNIVIFIRFADESQSVFPDSIASYDRMFNSPLSGANSMYNYYREVSYNQQTILSTFYPSPADSVYSYVDTHSRNYYRRFNAVTNSEGYGSSAQARVREQIMLASAVRAVESQIPVGLNIDANSDGLVDDVCFIVSGDVDAWADLLWPHADWLMGLDGVDVRIHGTLVRYYNFQLRGFLLHETSGNNVLCHEMFHCLGAPDLYDYVNHGQPDERFPIWIWDLMGEKNPPNRWLNPPPHMCAYMKYKYGGWINSIPIISKAGTYTISPLLSATNNCYRIPSLFSSSEYFMVEFRKKSGTFESSLPGEGLLVYRINPQRVGNADGPPYEVYVYRPGGTLTVNGTPDSAALSANSGRGALTDSTEPSSFLTDGSLGGLILTGVGFLGDTITFTVDFPKLPVIALNTRAIYLEPISDDMPRRDTTFMVRNIGFALDSITASIDPRTVTPDSAIAIIPTSFTLAAGDSQMVEFHIRPPLLASGFYQSSVIINSRFSFGQKSLSVLVEFEKVTGVSEPSGLPKEFALEQNYPNPFNPTTTITYELPNTSVVRVSVYDMLGREVSILVNDRRDAGVHQVRFDGSAQASGVYFYRLQTGDFVQSKKLMLLK